jgi:hypothetical protein
MIIKIDTGSATDKYPDGYVIVQLPSHRKGGNKQGHGNRHMDMETDINTDAWYGQGHSIYVKGCILSCSYICHDIIITFRHLQIGHNYEEFCEIETTV